MSANSHGIERLESKEILELPGFHQLYKYIKTEVMLSGAARRVVEGGEERDTYKTCYYHFILVFI